ncbi:hypothetical protein [Candidatus Nitrospira neomarina]|uniref:Uncharacterized protein n=1 Tax=Candidatus Nitrospira neomarina TaxID=3020899 RepID=A0AA96GMG5_9BACT|nr:hypothetical protein [Candidatus Nitrospira neomarina]WNM63557.1 hypothetical protein PQG83_07335 [Candidatus Nitrospira neomarina]
MNRMFRSQALVGEIEGKLTEPITFRSATPADALINRRTVDPTPAGWPKGGTLLSVGGPCLSHASWSALLRIGVHPLQ